MSAFWIMLALFVCASGTENDDGENCLNDLKELITSVSTSLNNMNKNFKNMDILKKIHELEEDVKHNLRKEISGFCNKFSDFHERPSPTPLPPPPTGKDCAEIYKQGKRIDGIYEITPIEDGPSFQVYCDMTTDDGGWTVFQRRGEYGLPKDYFYKTWNEYKSGFGNLTTEFWLGNDKLALLTMNDTMELRVDIESYEGEKAYAKYGIFQVNDESDKYRLTVLNYTGNASDSLSYSNNLVFSTKDRDSSASCTKGKHGAWWYKGCSSSNLNGVNMRGNNGDYKTIHWYHWKKNYYSLSFAEMKLRPRDFISML